MRDRQLGANEFLYRPGAIGKMTLTLGVTATDATKVTLDDHDITTIIRSLRVEADAGEITTVHMEVYPSSLRIFAEGQTTYAVVAEDSDDDLS